MHNIIDTWFGSVNTTNAVQYRAYRYYVAIYSSALEHQGGVRPQTKIIACHFYVCDILSLICHRISQP